MLGRSYCNGVKGGSGLRQLHQFPRDPIFGQQNNPAGQGCQAVADPPRLGLGGYRLTTTSSGLATMDEARSRKLNGNSYSPRVLFVIMHVIGRIFA